MAFRQLAQKLNRTDWLLFGAVMLIAVFFRFYNLNSVPPGLLSDTAINGSDAWRLFNRGGHTPFLAGNGGRESLFIYLQGLSIDLLGTTPLATRLPGAIIDSLAVGLGFWFVYWFLQTGNASTRRWAALWAGLAMASSDWLVSISRLGFRGVLVPFVSLALFLAFLIGWQRGKLRWFALAGFLLGLAGYTYSAAKILPVVLVLAVLPELPKLLLPGKGRRTEPINRSRLIGLLIAVGVAALVYLPMLGYTLNAPGQLTNRPFSVAIWAVATESQPVASLFFESAIDTLNFFCCRGNDKLLMFGLPGKPAMSAGFGLMLLLGISAAMRYFTVMRGRLLMLWFGLGLLPGILAIEAPHPLRLIAAAPPTFILLALGLATLSHWVVAHRRVLAALIITLWLGTSAIFSFNDYFIRWPQLASTGDIFQSERIGIAETLFAAADAGNVVYLPRDLYALPPLRYLLTGRFSPQAAPFDIEPAENVVFFAPDTESETVWVRLGEGRATILPPFSPETVALLADLSETDTISPVNPANLSWLPMEKLPEYAIPPLKLTGMIFPPVLPAQNTLDVTLFWEATVRPAQDYLILLQLVDDGNRVWSLDDSAQPAGGAYPASYWQPGIDVVPDTHRLHLKDTLPPGRYRLAVAVIDPLSGERLPLQNPPGESQDTLFVGPLKVPLPPVSEIGFSPMESSEPTRFDGVAELAGYRLSASMVRIGELLDVALLWRATVDQPAADYTVFVHVIDAAGYLVAGHDAQPVNGAYPTGIWSAGETIIDTHSIDTANLSPGGYRLDVGFYRFETGERVSLADGTLSVMLPIELEVVE